MQLSGYIFGTFDQDYALELLDRSTSPPEVERSDCMASQSVSVVHASILPWTLWPRSEFSMSATISPTLSWNIFTKLSEYIIGMV